MCGRYALGLDAEELVAALDGTEGLEDTQWPDRDRYEAGRYNIAPRTHNPIIRRSRSPSSEDNDDGAEGHERATSKSAPANEMTTAAVWGLIPHWMKRADKVGQLKTINARDDTVCAGGMWTSMRHKRCIVIAEGFYEWQKKGAKDKVAHFTKMKGDRLMCFAGFWDSVRYEGEQEAVMSYTIITTASNDQLNFLHDRMPVILATKEARQLWLDADHPWDAKVAALLKPLDRPLDCYAVPPEVGKVGNNSPDFIKPVAQRKGNIASMFAKQASTSPDKGKRSVKAASPSDEKASLVFNPDEGDKLADSIKKSPTPAAKRVKEEVIELGSSDVETDEKPAKKARKNTPRRVQQPLEISDDEDDGHGKPQKITSFFASPKK